MVPQTQRPTISGFIWCSLLRCMYYAGSWCWRQPLLRLLTPGKGARLRKQCAVDSARPSTHSLRDGNGAPRRTGSGTLWCPKRKGLLSVGSFGVPCCDVCIMPEVGAGVNHCYILADEACVGGRSLSRNPIISTGMFEETLFVCCPTDVKCDKVERASATVDPIPCHRLHAREC